MLTESSSVPVRFSNLWNRIWFEPLAPYPLAAFRIAFGIYLLGFFLKFLSIVELSFSSEGVYSSNLLGDLAPPPLAASAIYYFTLAAIVALTVGWLTRMAGVLVLLLFVYHFQLNWSGIECSFDRLNTIILVVLCIVDSGAAWSIDARRRKETHPVPAWHIRLLQFQLAALYFGNGLWKLVTPAWHDGALLQLTLASEWGSPLAFRLLGLHLPDWFFTGATWAVIAFELFAGFGLYWRATRTWTMLAGTAFHLCNTFLLVIPAFLDCLAMYALFIDFGAWVGRGTGAGRHAASNAPGATESAASDPADCD